MNTSGQMRFPRTCLLLPLALTLLALAPALSAADRPATTPAGASPPPDPQLVERWDASLQEIRFDTADPKRPGAWAWSVLLRRKPVSEATSADRP